VRTESCQPGQHRYLYPPTAPDDVQGEGGRRPRKQDLQEEDEDGERARDGCPVDRQVEGQDIGLVGARRQRFGVHAVAAQRAVEDQLGWSVGGRRACVVRRRGRRCGGVEVEARGV